MTVMKMKEITDLSESLANSVPTSQEEVERITGEVDNILNALGESAEQAREIIMAKMPEKDYVDFLQTLQKITTFSSAMRGEFSLTMAMASGELTGYTHSVILATIGALINEEIL